MAPALDPREKNRLNIVLGEVVEMFVKDHVEDQHFKMFGTIGIELDNKDAVVFHFERDILNARRKKADNASVNALGLDIKQERDLATQSNAVRAAVNVEKPKNKNRLEAESEVIEERPYAEFDELPSMREEHRVKEEKVVPHKKVFSCGMCSQVFNTMVELQNHEKTHESAESATTDDGNDAINPTTINDSSASAMATSLSSSAAASATPNASVASSTARESKGSGPSKKHMCCYCSKGFATPYSLNTHIRIHTGEKPFECEVCGERFSQKSQIKTHARIHTGEKPFECEVCGEKFTQKASLVVHMRIHTGEKPYACDFCDSRFADSSALRKHIRIHTGEKPYQCQECGKAFTTSSQLNRHAAVHLKKRESLGLTDDSLKSEQ